MARDIDWEAIEREWRAGQLSAREIGAQYGVAASTVTRRAKKEGWSRDLSGQVRKRVRAKAAESAAKEHAETTGATQSATSGATDGATQRNVTDAEDDAVVVEQAALRGVQVVDLHRRDIRQGRELVEMMTAELRAECELPGLAELAEQQADEENASAARAAAIRKAVSLPGRAGVMRDLSQSLQRLVALERQAYSLDEREDDESYESQLRRLVGDG